MDVEFRVCNHRLREVGQRFGERKSLMLLVPNILMFLGWLPFWKRRSDISILLWLLRGFCHVKKLQQVKLTRTLDVDIWSDSKRNIVAAACLAFDKPGMNLLSHSLRADPAKRGLDSNTVVCSLPKINFIHAARQKVGAEFRQTIVLPIILGIEC
jgi:hypothetical protein